MNQLISKNLKTFGCLVKLLQNTISLKNTNVDIAAKDYDGNLTEVQAKFYKGKVSKAGLDSFVAETGKMFILLRYLYHLLINVIVMFNQCWKTQLNYSPLLDLFSLVILILIGKSFHLLKKIKICLIKSQRIF